jgi:hypothetical protein
VPLCRRQVTCRALKLPTPKSKSLLGLEGSKVGRDGFGKGFEVVAAFEGGDDAAVAVVVGQADDELRDPGEVVFVEVNVTEGIGGVGIEAGGDEEDLWLEGRDGGGPVAFDGLAEGGSVGAGAERSVDEVGAAEIGWIMDAFERFERDCVWPALLEVRKLSGLSEMGEDRLGAPGAFRVAVVHGMPVVGGVGEESEIHGRLGRSQTRGSISK